MKDAAALARSIAAARGRNATWAEQAVLESASITAGEAVDEGVIDLVADTRSELLRRIDGRRIVTAATDVTLDTMGASVVEQPMNLAERILHTLTDPNIAYLLLSLGMIGLIAELYSPGLLFPGITGAISLIVAFVAFGSLPLNWAALALLVLAAGLVVAERRSASQTAVRTRKELTRSLPQGAPKPARTTAKRRKGPRAPATTAGKAAR